MRRFLRFSVLCLALGAANACKPEEVFITEDIPTAGIRFLNVVPDTGAVDFRPVDIVENSTFYNMAHRGTGLFFYKNARAGARHFRIFMSPDPALTAAEQQAMASTVVWDSVVDLQAGRLYTFILWGYSRTGSTPARRLTVIEDTPSDPGAQVALRVVHAAPGLGALDVRAYKKGDPLPAAPTWAGVAEFAVSGYQLANPDSILFNFQPAGGGANVIATDPLALVGVAANITGDINPIPGTRVAGSAVSGFIVPASVIPSKAPQTLTTPGFISVWDRRPPNAPKG